VYASVRRYRIDPDSAGEEMARVKEGFVPIVSEVPGFIAYYDLDAGDGVIASITIFEDQAGAEESNRMAAEWVKQNVASLFPDPPEITAGEVIVHHAA